MSPAAREIWIDLIRRAVSLILFALAIWLFSGARWLPLGFDNIGQALLSFVVLIAYFWFYVFAFFAVSRLAERWGVKMLIGEDNKAAE